MWIACEVYLSDVAAPWTALVIATVVCLGAGLVSFAMAGTPRARVRTMAAMVMAGHHDPISGAVRERLEELADTLLQADERLAGGHISAAQYELVWWQVYDQMSPSSAPGMHPSSHE